MPNDLLLNETDDLLIRNGDFAVGDGTMDDVSIVLRLNKGELKADPILGPNLLQFIKSNARPDDVQAVAALHITRNGNDYNEVKNKIKYSTK